MPHAFSATPVRQICYHMTERKSITGSFGGNRQPSKTSPYLLLSPEGRCRTARIRASNSVDKRTCYKLYPPSITRLHPVVKLEAAEAR